jgi:hypothetical protein
MVYSEYYLQYVDLWLAVIVLMQFILKKIKYYIIQT